MDLGELYAGPWQDFIARRDRMVAAAKAAGDRSAAQALKALRKPTRAAWLVNLLARHEADQLAEVFELGESLARAHRDADPSELRRLSALRGAVIGSLTSRANALGAERGYAAPDSVRQEVSETIQAAMADPALADRVLTSTLTTTVRAAGFGPADLFAPAPPMAEVIQLRPSEPEPVGPDPGEVRRLSRELGRAEARWEEAEVRLRRTQEAAAAAEQELREQEERLVRASERTQELRVALDAAEQDERAIRARREELTTSAESTRSARERAGQESDHLRELVDRLTKELADLD